MCTLSNTSSQGYHVCLSFLSPSSLELLFLQKLDKLLLKNLNFTVLEGFLFLLEVHFNAHEVVSITELLFSIFELLSELDLKIENFGFDVTVVLAQANSMFVVVSKLLDRVLLQKLIEYFETVFKEVLSLSKKSCLVAVHDLESDWVGVDDEGSALSTEFQSFDVEI